MPLGIDVVEPPFLFALQKLGIDVRDGQQVMLDAREIKSHDEITLLNMAAAMGDGVYQDIFEALKPGIRENEIVALATKRLYEMGSDCVEAINAIAGERCSPHPHNFTDRMIRPGDQAYFDIIQSYMGYRTCYYRTFTVGRRRSPARRLQESPRWMDDAIDLLKPGVAPTRSRRLFPQSTEIGFETEMAAFGLNFCHGLGLGLHERPLISRLNSFKDPDELKAGMVFAVETFCPAADGVSAARIEEEVVLTPDGAKVITLFPAQELPIANRVLEPASEKWVAQVVPAMPASSFHNASRLWTHRLNARKTLSRRSRSDATCAWSSTASSSSCAIARSARTILFLQNLIKGTSHLSLGQEAIAAGFGVAMRPDDWTFCTYRGHAHTLARGASMAGVLGELMGRECGLLGGKGGSMHLTDVSTARWARTPSSARICRLPQAPHGVRSIAGPSRSPCASSATARRTSARSTRL